MQSTRGGKRGSGHLRPVALLAVCVLGLGVTATSALASQPARAQNLAVYGAAVRVRVEDVHENRQLERIAIEVRIARFLDHHDASIGRRDNRINPLR